MNSLPTPRHQNLLLSWVQCKRSMAECKKKKTAKAQNWRTRMLWVYAYTKPSRPQSKGRDASCGAELYFVVNALDLELTGNVTIKCHYLKKKKEPKKKKKETLPGLARNRSFLFFFFWKKKNCWAQMSIKERKKEKEKSRWLIHCVHPHSLILTKPPWNELLQYVGLDKAQNLMY